MIFEIAEIEIKPGTDAEFEAAVAKAAPYFKAAENCHSLRLEKTVENPLKYRLVVGWSSVDDHMVTFRNSEGFQQWRALASPFFAVPPSVEHVHCVLDAF